MALSVKSTLRVAPAARPARATVVVKASAENVESRRQVLGLFAAAVGAAVFPQQASAIGLPWQESTGGMLKGKGSVTKSSTTASMEGYTLDGYPGTKKPSYVPSSKKKALLAKVRAQAEGKK